MNASEPTTAYLFVHFTGLEQSETDEQLYFALSRDGRHWRDLREAGFPVLTWKGGEGGVRDPLDWAAADDIDFGRIKKRHGAILPITEAEYEAIEDTFTN